MYTSQNNQHYQPVVSTVMMCTGVLGLRPITGLGIGLKGGLEGVLVSV